MTDEELYEAQPKKDFKFNMYDENTRVEYRDVVVPNWIAADGRWGDVHNALMAAGNRNFATATEKIVQVLERAREYGRMEVESGREPEGKLHTERWAAQGPQVRHEYVAQPLTSQAKARQDLIERSYRGLRRPFDPNFPLAEQAPAPVFEL